MIKEEIEFIMNDPKNPDYKIDNLFKRKPKAIPERRPQA